MLFSGLSPALIALFPVLISSPLVLRSIQLAYTVILPRSTPLFGTISFDTALFDPISFNAPSSSSSTPR